MCFGVVQILLRRWLVMTGVGSLRGPVTDDVVRGFAGTMARVGRGGAQPASASTPTASDVRASARAIGEIVRDAVTAATRQATTVVGDTSGAGSGAASALAPAVEKVNDMLDMLARSRDVSADFRVSLVNAVRGAVAAVPASGLALSSIDGKERVVMDTAPLEEALAKDPHALDALMGGAQGLPEGVSVALATIPDPPAAPPARPATAVAIDRHLAETLRAVRVTNELGKLQLLSVVPMRAAIPARRGVDMLA
jgi:hypothetical protein